ncbi:hypothetical protein ACWGTI_23055 [Mesorhizobium sp. ArgA1]
MDDCGFIVCTSIKSPRRIERGRRQSGWPELATTIKAFIKGHEKAIDEEQLRCVPAELDLTPYKDLKDHPLLRGLVQASQ